MKTYQKIESFDSLKIYSTLWQPDNSPQALLVIIHGMGEHSQRYEKLAQYLAAKQIAVFTFDLRGHGLSQGRLGHINQWQDYRLDHKYALESLPDSLKQIPHFYFGHSLGALITLEMSLHSDFRSDGLILSGIPIESTAEKNALKRNLAIIMSTLWPTLRLKVGVSRQQLSHSEETLREHKEDDLTHGWGTARWGYETLKAIRFLRENANRIELPLLQLHGENDPVANLGGARSLFEQFSSTDKQLITYANTLHEPHTDLVADQVFDDIYRWLGAKIEGLE